MACLNWGLLTVESMAAVASPPDSPCSLAGKRSFILDMKSGFSSKGLMTWKKLYVFTVTSNCIKGFGERLDVLTSPVIPTDRSTAGSFDPPAPNPSAPAGTLMPVKPSTKINAKTWVAVVYNLWLRHFYFNKDRLNKAKRFAQTTAFRSYQCFSLLSLLLLLPKPNCSSEQEQHRSLDNCLRRAEGCNN